jgi:hypothetical protein
VTSRRAILELRGIWERYTIRLVEIVTPDGREYRYYVFDGAYIVAGFNNHADLSAIRLRYGADWKQHRYEPISHLHLENKTKLELTEEMTCQQFLTWMELNLCTVDTC